MAELLTGWRERAAARQAVRRSRSGYAALRAVGLGLGAVLLAGSAASVAPSMLIQAHTQPLDVPSSMASMTSLTVTSPRGDVAVAEVGEGGRPQVVIDKGWTLNEPGVGLTDHGDGSWTLSSSCEGGNLGHCWAGVDMLVPEGTDVTVVATFGDVDVRSSGTVDARSTSGDITVEGRPESVAVLTTFGQVLVDSAEHAPGSVEVRTTAGDIDVRLPRSQEYAVLAETTHGERTVTLPTRAGAPHTVTARTTFGNLDVVPAG